MEAIKRTFSPEFRNRLDSIVQFQPLTPDVVRNIVDKFIMELEVQLEEQGVHFKVDKKARVWLSERGYNKQMGARPMARLIQEKIKKPLADELLFGLLAEGGDVTLSESNDKLTFEINNKQVDLCQTE